MDVTQRQFDAAEEIGRKCCAEIFLAGGKFWPGQLQVPSQDESIGIWLLERDGELPLLN